MSEAARDDNYPYDWEADVVLRDGSVAHVRPIRPADTAALHRFHEAQSEESIYLRFFAPMRHLSDKDVYHFTHVDHDQRVALVATVGEDIIGIARCDRLDDPTIAEVAFNISDHYQGRGVGSILLEHLAAIGRDCGIKKFIADVLPQNRKMMTVFNQAGYEVTGEFEDGVISVYFRIEETEQSQAVMLAREHHAESRNMCAILAPHSVAVVGVSRRPDAIGSIVLDNILDAGFTGEVHIVNAEATSVRGLKANARVSDIGSPVDLAIICVPANAVPGVVTDCGEAGVRTIVVLASGFAESGAEGEERQAALVHAARQHGMRVIGPSSFGLVNNDPSVRLNATIARTLPPAGSLALFTQSGGLGVAVLASAARRSLGVSAFASAGNRVDVSSNDFMQYLIDDERTKTVGLYLESVGNPRKFSRIARQLSLRKPVVAVKAGTTGEVPPGRRARATSVSAAAFDALLKQAGIISAVSVHELVDICELVGGQPLTKGNRVAVIGNSTGVSGVTAEHATRRGLQVTRGPVRMPPQTSLARITQEVEAAYLDPEVDGIIIALVPPLAASEEAVATAISHLGWAHDKPCAASFLGMRDVAHVMRRTGRFAPEDGGDRLVVPTYKTPLDAVSAFAATAQYAAWHASDRGEPLQLHGVRRGVARRIVDRVLAESPGGRALTIEETQTVLAGEGIQMWPTTHVDDADEAVEAGEKCGYPLLLRTMIPSLRNRPGAGARRSDLSNADEVRAAFEQMHEQFSVFPDPQIVVQKVPPQGVETVLRTTEDVLFGPVVSFGLAGVPSDLLEDLTYRIPPLTTRDVPALIDSLRAAPLLNGYRGGAAVDRAALEDVIARVSVLADEIPELAHLELSPLNARSGGVDVLGADIIVAPASTRMDAGRRTLS